jgi:protocatechuate 3,4-dioxygenase beta subunit
VKKITSILLLFMLVSLLSGCKNSDVLKPAAGTAIVTGRIVSVNTGKPYSDVYVWLADIYRNADGGGAYALDTSSTINTTTDSDGNYIFKDIKPGEYVLVFGDPMTNYFIVSDENHKPQVWTAEGDKILEVGTLKIDLD